jgi:hypothetical protein
LVRPYGVQVENIRPRVQHIDLVYFAVADEAGATISTEHASRDRAGWYAPADLPGLGANDEIQQWIGKLMCKVRDRPGDHEKTMSAPSG